ncbi:hypothetical protein [Streptomyces cinereoruber]|uniref:hypothetical protein n=1 Tax=Streptomyces cinereoruber TaxID=67260 RepID=UPI0036324615
MAGWDFADIQNGSGTGRTEADKEYGRRWSREQRQGSSQESIIADHYAEKAAAREAERREAEEWAAKVKEDRESHKREELARTFWEDEPAPISDPSHPDFLSSMNEARKRLNAHIQRAEGEELAARIFRRW